MIPKKFVLFDFDGVIADSYDVAWDTAHTLCKRVTEKEYLVAFEGNIHEAYDSLMVGDHGTECRHDLDWFSVFTPAFEERAEIFSGIREVIESLSHSYILIIVSSTITSPIQGFLEKRRIGRYFSEVMGADVHTSKSKKIEMV
ncbi:MAG: HAD hydrolase-like protein, partial [Patescibacteria group bacterium]